MILGTQDKDFFPSELRGKFNFIREMGFDCFEIDGKVLVDHLDEVLAAKEQSGLIISSACGGYDGWIGDFDESRRLNSLREIKQIMKCLKLVGGSGIVLPAAWGMFSYRLPPMVPPRSSEDDRKTILKSLVELEDTAGENDISIFLEPLNRYQDHMLNLTKDAVDIIEEGDLKYVKVTADFYHMSIEEDDISETLKRYSRFIGHIHIAENHRYQPGSGSIDFKRHFETLRQMGYSGAIVNEGRVRGENPLEAYRESLVYIRSILDK